MPGKFRVRLTQSAQRDIEDIWDYIAAHNASAAARFVRGLERQMLTLERSPERCAYISENKLMGTKYRQLHYGKYRTIFKVDGKVVYVMRIVHGARMMDTALFDD